MVAISSASTTAATIAISTTKTTTIAISTAKTAAAAATTFRHAVYTGAHRVWLGCTIAAMTATIHSAAKLSA